MHLRHLSFLAAILLPCMPSGASAQIRQPPPPTSPANYAITIEPGSWSMTAKEIRWSGVAPNLANSKLPERPGVEAAPRVEHKLTKPSVELIWLTQSNDSKWASVPIGSDASPSEVTITAMNAQNVPLARYVLHGVIPTRFWVDHTDNAASPVALTHLILEAQSVATVPIGP